MYIHICLYIYMYLDSSSSSEWRTREDQVTNRLLRAPGVGGASMLLGRAVSVRGSWCMRVLRVRVCLRLCAELFICTTLPVDSLRVYVFASADAFRVVRTFLVMPRPKIHNLEDPRTSGNKLRDPKP